MPTKTLYNPPLHPPPNTHRYKNSGDQPNSLAGMGSQCVEDFVTLMDHHMDTVGHTIDGPHKWDYAEEFPAAPANMLFIQTVRTITMHAWSELKTALLRNYRAVEPVSDARTRLIALSQGPGTVRDCNHCFMMVLSEVPDVSHADQLFNYIIEWSSGLSDDVRGRIALHQPNS